MSEDGAKPIRILFVFAWLVVGGEETEVRLLARNLDPKKYRIDVVACFRKPGMSEQTHLQLNTLGIDVDRTLYELSFEDTIDYLARKITAYDIVVSCQNVPDIYPALEKLHWRPPLIEHGGLVSEALAGPKHFTSRYVGVCRAIREAAASKMPGRESCAVEIASMVDLSEFGPVDRARVRTSLHIAPDALVVGWVGRLDAKKRVEDLIKAAALLRSRVPNAFFLVVGGPDAFMPDYAEQLKNHAAILGLSDAMSFLGDRDDVPELLAAMDIFIWLSRGEGMPHVISEAGAAGLPVIATADNGSIQQIEHGVSGLFVPHESPVAVAAAIEHLTLRPELRTLLGRVLRRKVEANYSAEVVVPQWQALFEEVLAERPKAPKASIFASFFQGGFECSTHKQHHGRRLDLIASTDHGRNAQADFAQLAEHGIRTVRDGFRWHLIEASPGRYNWSSVLPLLQAMRETGTQILWDLMHYGWPDHVDLWSASFSSRFARFAANAARLIRSETDSVLFFCLINEISFFSWAGGDVAFLNPFARGRGFELKVQLARAAIAAMHEILAVDPRARFIHCEPVINIVTDPSRPYEWRAAESSRQAQYQAWDIISGRMWPQLGGDPRLLDIIGVNYYSDNQWIHGGPPIDLGHALYKSFRYILAEVFARYGRPLLISETGSEGDRRASWVREIARESEAAREAGVPVEGICLYPIIEVGWVDEGDCQSGLLSRTIHDGRRTVCQPLADVLRNHSPSDPR